MTVKNEAVAAPADRLVRDHAADLPLFQARFQRLPLRYLRGVANDFAGRGIGGDGITAFQNVRRRKQTQSGFQGGKVAPMPADSLVRLLAEAAVEFVQVFAATRHPLRGAHSEQSSMRTLPERLALAPTVFHPAP